MSQPGKKDRLVIGAESSTTVIKGHLYGGFTSSPTSYSHHRHHLSVFTALPTHCHSAAWSLFNSSDTHWQTVCTLLESSIFLAGNQIHFTLIHNPCTIPATFFPSAFFHCIKASFICHISYLFKGTRLLNKLINRAAQGFISHGCVCVCRYFYCKILPLTVMKIKQ